MIGVMPALVATMLLQPAVVIDDFESVAAWRAQPSDDVSLAISQDSGVTGKSIKIDFDFHGHGGYAVIRRDLKLSLPANYEFSFSIRGQSPVNTLEFKLVDPTGDNVWWSNQPGFVFPSQWSKVLRKKRHITFAWGPLGGGEMKEVAGIEIAITAGSGGKGTVWLDDLVMTPLEPQGVYDLVPAVSSTRSGGDERAPLAMDADSSTAWRASSGSAMLSIDFLKRREFGGLVVDWERNARPDSYTVSISTDARSWTRVFSVGKSSSARDFVFLPESDARYMRFELHGATQAALREIKVMPLAWSATKNDFFTAVARDAAPGTYPRFFSQRQSYWTVIGVSGDTREALIDEQGIIETGKGQFSIEPFLFTNGKLITWNDADRSSGMVGGDLPIPFVNWKTPALEMRVTGYAAGKPDSSILYARYRVRNSSSTLQNATLFLGVRPFQVNPPWQFLNTQGGFAPIDSISYNNGLVRINGERFVIPLTKASAFGAMSFDEGNIVDQLRLSRLPPTTSASDALGRTTGALSWMIALRPGADTTIDVAVPMHAAFPRCAQSRSIARCNSLWARSQLDTTETAWRKKLSRVAVSLPSFAARIPSAIRANLAYILINRDGPSIQPGSRSYERSWIRDGALTSAALLRLGQYDEVREFIDWYSKFQFDNGKIPCCVDSRGADPVPENDSHGEFIYLIAEYFRHTGDRALLERTWPNVTRAVAFMDSLRLSRTTPEFQTGEKQVFYGLMPQSISHEGYSAKPMHSYWDDFFALRGFKDAVEIATVLAKPEVTRYAAARDQFRKDFYASIALSMRQHKIDYIPGAAELGDFDATSTTIAVNPGDEQEHLPRAALNRTFEKYYENFVIRRDKDSTWEAYTPYEWRTVGTFVRLGQKAKAHEIADFFFEDQRPKAWHHWAEVVFRDSLNPKFIGDMPHTWVGSDFIRSALDMFAFEQESDSSLVIGAGILDSWVREANGASIRRLSTHYGQLSYTMRQVGREIEVRIESGLRMPPGGLVIRSPATRSLRGATINGKAVAAGKDEVIVRSLPATVTLRY